MVDKNDKEKQEQQEKLKKFKFYFAIWLDDLKKDLEEIEKITEPKKRYTRISILCNRHENNRISLASLYANGKLGEVGISYSDTIGNYAKKIEELKKIQAEIKKESKEKGNEKEFTKTKTSQQSNSQFKNQNNSQEFISCSQCLKKIKSTYYYNKVRNDNNKFCSNKCYVEYYGKICNKCSRTSLDYHPDLEHSNIFYCSSCYEKKQQEELEKVKKKLAEKQESNEEWEPMLYCRYCGIRCYNIFSVCEKEECLKKIQVEIAQKQGINDEREQNSNHFSNMNKSELNHKIQSFQNQISQLENQTSSESKKLLKSKKEELRELEEKLKVKENTQQENKTKLWLGIGCGILGVCLVGLIVYLVAKNRKESK